MKYHENIKTENIEIMSFECSSTIEEVIYNL